MIKNDTQLCAVARSEMEDGKYNFANFILGKNEKSRNEIIKTSWKIHESSKIIARSKKSRIEILEQVANTGTCICQDLWRECNEEVLINNAICPTEFANMICTALRKGRGKEQNVMIVHPANCGKTFVLKPLTEIYETFVNPASGTCAWVGAELAEVVF